MGQCARSDWSKTHVLSEYKIYKKRVLLFRACKIYIIKQMKKPKPCITGSSAMIKHSGHLRTLEISLMFSNACRVLSKCNTRLRLPYLLNNDGFFWYRNHIKKDCST